MTQYEIILLYDVWTGNIVLYVEQRAVCYVCYVCDERVGSKPYSWFVLFECSTVGEEHVSNCSKGGLRDAGREIEKEREESYCRVLNK